MEHRRQGAQRTEGTAHTAHPLAAAPPARRCRRDRGRGRARRCVLRRALPAAHRRAAPVDAAACVAAASSDAPRPDAATAARAATSAAPAAAPVPATAGPKAAFGPATVHDFVTEMAIGTWLLFRDGDAETPARLFWVSPLRTRYIFTTRGRGKALSFTPEELAWQLGAGRATLIVEPVPLFDRAVSAALDTLAARAPAAA
ncbi:MAG: DUF1631 family protein [Betaproteobacteria bacterium]|nr:DUF1631 family protein [Betaproteobacteria bacterium]